MRSLHKGMRICVVGDSQMGSLRLADEAGLFEWPASSSVEYWGATGPQFRDIRWKDGAIQASGGALDTVRQVNVAGRDALLPSDFDVFLFYGARLRVVEYFAPLLEWHSTAQAWPSAAVLDASAKSFLACTRVYRMARQIAEAGARSIFVPSPFPTDGIRDQASKGGVFHAYPATEIATSQQRQKIWACLKIAALDEGVELVAQPEATITRGLLTREEFARSDAYENNDAGHKNPEFAAIWITEVLKIMGAQNQAA